MAANLKDTLEKPILMEMSFGRDISVMRVRQALF